MSRETGNDRETTNLFRPVGPKELALIEHSGFLEFPPRLEGQPYFYPVANEEYAIQIARDWNAKSPEIGSGYVTRFRVRTDYLNKFSLQTAGSAVHKEYWIPAEELPEFNRNIIGKIEVIHKFPTPRT
jgi:hypothetical protein